MSFRQGLVAARGHIVFIAALLTAFALIVGLDRAATRSAGTPADAAAPVAGLAVPAAVTPLAAPSPLSDADNALGRVAWRYFVNNTDPDTGLAHSVDGFPSTTMWDTGSFLIAMISAHRLGYIDTAEFDRRLTLALASLARIPLFDGTLPNKVYDTHTLGMVDYVNTPTARGLGWSAIDMARLLVPLLHVERTFPAHAAEVRAVLARLDLPALVRNGALNGAAVKDGKTVTYKEGRVGYEQYAARIAIMAGLDAFTAWDVSSTLRLVDVEGLAVPVDARSDASFAISEPYTLAGLDLGLDDRTARLADAVYRAQEARFARTGILTAVSEGHVDQAPYFVYSTVVAGGVPFAVVNLHDEQFSGLRTLSTKTAFAWDALYRTPYTAKLVAAVRDLEAADGGFMEGIYEESGKPNTAQTANTNAIILASLAYRAFGPLLVPSPTAPGAAIATTD